MMPWRRASQIYERGGQVLLIGFLEEGDSTQHGVFLSLRLCMSHLVPDQQITPPPSKKLLTQKNS